jgi:cytochrome c oxidase cbb3-type subunit 1
MQSNAQLEYDYSVVKLFTFTTILFGIIGMLVGVILAFQLAFPELSNLAGEYGTFCNGLSLPNVPYSPAKLLSSGKAS